MMVVVQRKRGARNNGTSLADASERARVAWGDRRGYKTDECQLRRSLDTLCIVLGKASTVGTPEEVTPDHVADCVEAWEAENLSSSTINKRLCVLSSIGVNAAGNWKSATRQLKWWLHPDKCEKLLSYLRSVPTPFPRAAITADYVEWASLVGMRVEESLRLTWSEVHLEFRTDAEGNVVSRSEVSVPGTKTVGSQATLALAVRPALLLKGRRTEQTLAGSKVFPISYDHLHESWQHCRVFLGVRDNPLATLKALRRTAARHLTTRGMPLDIVRQYLRHSNVNTTMGYLRLTGGYTTEEQRKWL